MKHMFRRKEIEMIVKKEWKVIGSFGVAVEECIGYYLFGIIPLYVKKKRLR